MGVFNMPLEGKYLDENIIQSFIEIAMNTLVIITYIVVLYETKSIENLPQKAKILIKSVSNKKVGENILYDKIDQKDDVCATKYSKVMLNDFDQSAHTNYTCPSESSLSKKTSKQNDTFSEKKKTLPTEVVMENWADCFTDTFPSHNENTDNTLISSQNSVIKKKKHKRNKKLHKGKENVEYAILTESQKEFLSQVAVVKPVAEAQADICRMWQEVFGQRAQEEFQHSVTTDARWQVCENKRGLKSRAKKVNEQTKASLREWQESEESYSWHPVKNRLLINNEQQFWRQVKSVNG